MTTTFLNLPPHLLPSSPPHLLTSSPPQLRRSLVPPVDKIPPHLLLLNSAALWYPQWTKYLLTSSSPQLLTSSTPPLSGTPSGQNTFSPLQLYRSLAAQVDKIPPPLLNFTLSGAPSGPHHALGCPKWPPPYSFAPPVVLSGASRGNLLCSLAPSNVHQPNDAFITTGAYAG